MNLKETIRESLRDLTKEPISQETKTTLGDIIREALVKKGSEMTEAEKDRPTNEVED